MLCMSLCELIFMCVKQECNFYFQKNDILVINRFLREVPMNLTDFFATRIRIRMIRIIDTNPDPGGQMMRIRTDLDPHHWHASPHRPPGVDIVAK